MVKKAEPVTKEYLKECLDEKFDKFEERMDRMLDVKLERKFEEKITPFRKEVYDNFDWLFNKIKKFDEEHIFHSSRIYGHEDQLENHEVRIGVLEKKMV